MKKEEKYPSVIISMFVDVKLLKSWGKVIITQFQNSEKKVPFLLLCSVEFSKFDNSEDRCSHGPVP